MFGKVINKNLISIGFKNALRDSKNIILIVLIGFILSIIMICFSFKSSLNEYWNGSILKLVDYRTYIVKYDPSKYNKENAIKKLKEYEHVEEVFDESSYFISMKVDDKSFVNDNNKNGIFLVGTVSDPIKLSDGKNLNSISNNEYPIICSKQFYPFVENEQKDYNVSKAIDISNKVGKNINLSFITSNTKEKFKIVGLYDAKENHTEGNLCYTRHDIVKKLNNKYQFDVYNENNEENNIIYMTIDNVKNEQNVIKTFENSGFSLISATLNLNKTLGNQVSCIILIICIVIMILSLSILIYIILKSIDRRNKNHMLLKSIGYSNNEVVNVFTIEIFFEFILSLFLSILLFSMFKNILQTFYISKKITFYDLKIKINYISLVINFTILIITIFVSRLILKYKLNKEEIVDLIK